MKFPETFRGVNCEEVLRRLEAGESPPPSLIIPTTKYTQDILKNSIILPSHTHGNYTYPDLLVDMQRSHGDTTWHQSHEALHQEQAFMLPPRLYADMINHLRSGRVHDGTGQPLPATTIDKLLDDIYTPRDPWRGEWLDALFHNKNKDWLITYHQIQPDSSLKDVTEPLEVPLMKSKYISLNDWLDRATIHGLPSPDSKKGDLHYWHPNNGAVVRFGAYAVRADLFCSGGPQVSVSALGVRPARVRNV